jgi:phosphatidyl-myo-inositol alpha-mannosyltransferase
VKIGIVCPYSFDVPGGVQAHVADLAKVLRQMGHHVEVLAPADSDAVVPDYVTPSGRAIKVPYNGSVARLAFGPVSFARVRRWIKEHEFDVLHLHEPVSPSLSMLALMVADGPIVATFHTSTPRSRVMTTFGGVLQLMLEKITARIAVSALARRVQVQHLGSDAVEIPNGVDVPFYANASPLPGYPRAGGTVGFVGRFDEPRKGVAVLLDALRPMVADRPNLQLLVVGPGDGDALRAAAGPELASRMVLLGKVDNETKARALRSVDVYCAPNLGGESFGIILTEAMAAGTPVLASDLDAFRRVLEDGDASQHRLAGELVPVGDSVELGRRLGTLLDDPARRARFAATGRRVVANYDWAQVAVAVLRVYEAAIAADPRSVVAGPEPAGMRT